MAVPRGMRQLQWLPPGMTSLHIAWPVCTPVSDACGKRCHSAGASTGIAADGLDGITLSGSVSVSGTG